MFISSCPPSKTPQHFANNLRRKTSSGCALTLSWVVSGTHDQQQNALSAKGTPRTVTMKTKLLNKPYFDICPWSVEEYDSMKNVAASGRSFHWDWHYITAFTAPRGLVLIGHSPTGNDAKLALLLKAGVENENGIKVPVCYCCFTLYLHLFFKSGWY